MCSLLKLSVEILKKKKLKTFGVCSDKMILKCLGNIYSNLETVLKAEKKLAVVIWQNGK